jgi:hypothetical protein
MLKGRLKNNIATLFFILKRQPDASLGFRIELSCAILHLFQTGIVNLGILAPFLRGNVPEGCHGSSLAFCRNTEQHRSHRKDTDSGETSVALPLLGVSPPSTIRGPNLQDGKVIDSFRQTEGSKLVIFASFQIQATPPITVSNVNSITYLRDVEPASSSHFYSSKIELFV